MSSPTGQPARRTSSRNIGGLAGRKSSKNFSVRSKTLQTQVSWHTVQKEVNFGEEVRVVGNVAALGNWDPALALPLRTSEGQFPCWVSPEPAPVETGTTIEYKYVVVSLDGSEPRWEERTGNRTFLASGAEMAIEDDDGLYRQHWNAPDPPDDDARAEARRQSMEAEEGSFECAGEVDKADKLAVVRACEQLPEGAAVLDSNDTIYLLAYRLPVTVVQGPDGAWVVDEKGPQDGRNFAMCPLLDELRRKRNMKLVCVGWPGVSPDTLKSQKALEKKLSEHHCIPIFPVERELQGWNKFNKEFLWPLFHDTMADFQSTIPKSFDMDAWRDYQACNTFFARQLLPYVHENDIIWIHDYHMLTAANHIARKHHRANIGFYLHAPFPSVNSFMTIPVREELLTGMLASDLIGFQFFPYARNFYLAVKRILGLDPQYQPGGYMSLDYNGRQVYIKVSHFVYPFQDTKQVVDQGGVVAKTSEITKLFPGRTLFASMDRCDGLSGLVPKFRAFRRFLLSKPEYKGKVLLIQYLFDDWNNSQLLKELKDLSDAVIETNELDELRISGAQGPPEDISIVLRHERTERTDRLALFRAADVLLDTCVKAGLNLMPFEFITAHHDDSEIGRCGVAVVSEFSGCSRVLLGSLRVNPWDTSQLAVQCEKALTMPPDQRLNRMETNLRYTSGNNTVEWFLDFLTDLRKARKKEGYRLESLGFGARMKQVSMAADFSKLPSDAVVDCYRNSKIRAIFLDNEGTLSNDKRSEDRKWGAISDLDSRGTGPDEYVLDCLRKLCEDPRNFVVILSGRNRQCMQEWFGSVKALGLAAERGYYYKVPNLWVPQWHCMDLTSDMSWKDQCFAIMAQFVKRTQGSFIENKGSALVWQYREADQVFGAWQARELAGSLQELAFGFDIQVVEGKGYVEVKLRGIDKGVAVSTVLSKISRFYGEVDFVLSIGDDRSDEDMFLAVQAAMKELEESALGDEDDEQPNIQHSMTDNHDTTRRASVPGQPSIPRGNSDDTSNFMRASPGMPGKPSGGFGARQSFGGGLSNLAASSSDFGIFGRSASGGLDSAGGGGDKYFTCTVGRKPTAAKFYLDDVDEVTELLGNLRAVQERKTRVLAYPETCPPELSGLKGGLNKNSRHGSMPTLASLDFESAPRRKTHGLAESKPEWLRSSSIPENK